MREDLLLRFVEETLNENNTLENAHLHFVKKNVDEVSFKRNHRKLYNKLLAFCSENNLTVIKTCPVTLATIIKY